MVRFRFIFFITTLWFTHLSAANDPFFENGKVTLQNNQTKKRIQILSNPWRFRHLVLSSEFIPALKDINYPSNAPSARFILIMHSWRNQDGSVMKDEKRRYIMSLFHQYHQKKHKPSTLWDAFGAMMLHKRYYSQSWPKYRDLYRQAVENFLEDYNNNRKPTLILRELAIDSIDVESKKKECDFHVFKKHLTTLYAIAQKGDVIAALYFSQFSLNRMMQNSFEFTLSGDKKEEYMTLLNSIFSLPIASSHQKSLNALALSSADYAKIKALANAARSNQKGAYQEFLNRMQSMPFPFK